MLECRRVEAWGCYKEMRGTTSIVLIGSTSTRSTGEGTAMHWWQEGMAAPKQPQRADAGGDGRVNEKGESKQRAAGRSHGGRRVQAASDAAPA